MLKSSIITSEGIVVGLQIESGNKRVFLQRDPFVSCDEIAKIVETLCGDRELMIDDNNHVRKGDQTILQLGQSYDGSITRQDGSLDLIGEVQPLSGIYELVDDGTVGKSEWRYKMQNFVSNIFPDGISGDIVFLSGLGNQEYIMWRERMVEGSKLIFVEGDPEKMKIISRKYSQDEVETSFLEARLGDSLHQFPDKLFSLISDHISVLSFDTESKLSPGLYDDLIEIFKKMYVDKDIFFGLNIVSRGSKAFLESLRQRISLEKFQGIDALPYAIMQDSQRTDITFKNVVIGEYIGGSGTLMKYMFLHITKK